jgi:hypothetical protein
MEEHPRTGEAEAGIQWFPFWRLCLRLIVQLWFVFDRQDEVQLCGGFENVRHETRIKYMMDGMC